VEGGAEVDQRASAFELGLGALEYVDGGAEAVEPLLAALGESHRAERDA
jgi:hypothetical protein